MHKVKSIAYHTYIFSCSVCLQSSLTFLILLVTFPSFPLTQTSSLPITLLSETSSQLPSRLPEQQEALIHDSKAGKRREGKGKVGAEYFMVCSAGLDGNDLQSGRSFKVTAG